MDTNGTPSETQLLKAALAWAARRMRVHLPATVEEYDAAKGAVSVRVDVGEYVRTTNGEVGEHEPVVPTVPVEWPGAGGARLTFPLRRGDTGLLLVCDRSLDEWKANASGQVLPRDRRTHQLTDAVFVPGLRRPAAPWKAADGGAVRTDAVTLGYEGGPGAEGMQLHITEGGMALGEKDPAYAVALAEKVALALTDLKAAIEGAVPIAQDGGVALQAGILLALKNWPPALGSTTVKVKE